MNGFVNVLKPVGATASDVVVCVKHILGERKVGHLGTLDPGASGVLPVAIGAGAKLFDFLTDKVKKYRAFFTFGRTTDTLDSYGAITGECRYLPTSERVSQALKGFIGEFDQIPPVYSAKSVGGVRAYKMARNGVEVQLKPRKITIYDIRLVEQKSADTFVVDITCGGGTYIRSIARDLAFELDTLGYMSGLIRLQSGLFDISNAYTLEEIRVLKEKSVLDIMYPLQDLDVCVLPDGAFSDLDNGRYVTCPFVYGYRKIFCKNVFFGLGKNVDGQLKIQYYLKNAL